jgi:hypothetical protein
MDHYILLESSLPMENRMYYKYFHFGYERHLLQSLAVSVMPIHPTPSPSDNSSVYKENSLLRNVNIYWMWR